MIDQNTGGKKAVEVEMELTKEFCRVCDEICAIHHAHVI